MAIFKVNGDFLYVERYPNVDYVRNGREDGEMD